MSAQTAIRGSVATVHPARPGLRDPCWPPRASRGDPGEAFGPWETGVRFVAAWARLLPACAANRLPVDCALTSVFNHSSWLLLACLAGGSLHGLRHGLSPHHAHRRSASKSLSTMREVNPWTNVARLAPLPGDLVERSRRVPAARRPQCQRHREHRPGRGELVRAAAHSDPSRLTCGVVDLQQSLALEQAACDGACLRSGRAAQLDLQQVGKVRVEEQLHPRPAVRPVTRASLRSPAAPAATGTGSPGEKVPARPRA